jgi:cytoskeletal protein CcmA (bactofilin family)
LWNKTRNEEVPTSPRNAAAPQVAPEPAPPPRVGPPPVHNNSGGSPAPSARANAASVGRQSAAIGASMTIKGEIRAREELLVDGEVEGTLESQSLLTIGPNGKVKANIKAREVVVYGSLRGNVEVAEKIAIREQGSLVGDIKAAGISIDDGAYFKGSIDIVRPEPKATGKPQKAEPKVEVPA